MGALDSVNSIIEGVKKVRAVAQKIHDAELQNALADLMGYSADLKMEIAELKSEILGLRDENSALKKKADIRARMRVVEGLLYPTEEIPGYGSGPFCPICLEKDGHLIAMWKNHFTGKWLCRNCKAI
jgi:hypothetical protein